MTDDEIRNEYIREYGLNDDVIADNEALKCVVRLVVSLLNNKVQYYGDRTGPTDFNKLHETLDRIKKEVENVQQKQRELDGNITLIQTTLADVRDSLTGQEQSDEALAKEKEESAAALADEREKSKRQLDDLQSKHAAEIDDLKSSSAAALEREQEKSKQQLDALKSKLLSLERTDAAWNSLTEAYAPVLENMQRCETFRSLLTKYNINTDTITPADLFTLATLIGRSIEFAKDVHNCALTFKQEHEEPLTSDEIAVYVSLNDCYRRIWGINFDIFVLPGGKAVTEEFTKIPFNKAEVVYMKNPRDKTNRYTQAVYVPILKAQNGNIHTLAQVKAGNM